METRAPALPAWTFRPAADSVGRGGDRYLVGLGWVLVGYAVAGRGFAYLGVPPLFIGEVALGLGLVALLAVRGAVAWPRPLGWLAVLVAAVAVRAALGVPRWGLDAVRDGMLVGYAGFAFVVAGLVLERPERLRDLVVRYGRLVVLVAVVAWPLHFAVRFLPGLFPTWPWAPDVTVVQTKPGDLLVHLAGATAFVVVGLGRGRTALLVAVIGAVGTLVVTSRAGMLAFAVAMGVVVLWKPAVGRAGRFVYLSAFVLVLGVSSYQTDIPLDGTNRTLSAEQVVDNVRSLVGRSDNPALKGTADWRLAWWGQIVGYTFGGEHFLTGKGFGINLATSDGFQVYEDESLRSPHNSHLTVLARGGVPLFLLWVLVQVLWAVSVAGARRRARRAGQAGWVAFFTVTAALWAAATVNGSFDVYLEGPMGGVWFWTVFGLGLAGAQLQRTHPALLDGLTAPPERPPAPPAPWSWRSPA